MPTSLLSTGIQFPDNTIQTTAASGSGGAAFAWVNFNGSTAGIRASLNVSSITRHAAGQYTINFINAAVDNNYVVCGITRRIGSGSATDINAGLSLVGGQVSTWPYNAVKTTSGVRILGGTRDTIQDSDMFDIIIFR